MYMQFVSGVAGWGPGHRKKTCPTCFTCLSCLYQSFTVAGLRQVCRFVNRWGYPAWGLKGLLFDTNMTVARENIPASQTWKSHVCALPCLKHFRLGLGAQGSL
jgi:hypothetical protein